MADGALRGTRLGALSYETDENVHLAGRQTVAYDCTCGTTIELPFSLEAEIPAVWECRCGAEALLRGGEWPEKKAVKPQRTHWDMLLERRSIRNSKSCSRSPSRCCAPASMTSGPPTPSPPNQRSTGPGPAARRGARSVGPS